MQRRKAEVALFQIPGPPSSEMSLKRKLPSEEQKEHSDPALSRSNYPSRDEYESGRVNCICGAAISFRDESTGGFTLKHWNTHRQQCSSASQRRPEAVAVTPSPSPRRTETVAHTPVSAAETMINNPTKRRRAKRTEEERIDYLRSDPYVAQFEAFRVLCGSCDKWIRLRPNSTYCSIPWDAHRKSCLSKKVNVKNVYALDERNSLLSKDPDVRKFDAERILCGICDRWIPVSPEDHLQAVQAWLHHRAVCQKSAIVLPQARVHRPPRQHMYLPRIETPLFQPERLSVLAPYRPSHPENEHHQRRAVSPDSSHPSTAHINQGVFRTTQDFTPTNFHTAQDSRRRNADQRAAMLRADPLVAEVEPSRIFCTLCRKWVRLRQDSSYCVYPWLQHRTKCLRRSSRRQDDSSNHPDVGETASDALDDMDSDSSFNHDHDHIGHCPDSYAHDPRSLLLARASSENDSPSHERRSPRSVGEVGRSAMYASFERNQVGGMRRGRDGMFSSGNPVQHRSRPYPAVQPADLDSAHGRRKFILASIHYLLSTTYEASDDLTVSALLTFLNAAVPPDKHEDFDTAELVKAAALFRERGEILFEGDTLRRVDQ